jgi:radical SAM superfamily enzyme YgiQ (UPF0313 family)
MYRLIISNDAHTLKEIDFPLKRNVYIIQANPVYGETEKTVYIPYAAGCIAAYAWADEKIDENFRLGRFVYTREDVETVAASFDAPFLAAFSCSVWNMEYNKVFAKRLKELYPSCIVLFGGHHVSPDTSSLTEYEYVDLLVHGSGEEAFRDVLLAFSENQNFEDIPNISFRDPTGKVVSTIKKSPVTSDYPSPYLEGYFDEILQDSIKFSAIIETNRGCPNKCSFCDWGDLQKKVVLFPYEKIEKELMWVAEHKIDYVYCADANFGLFERDDKITDLIARLKTEKGYPQRFRVNIAKNINGTVKGIVEKFHDNSLDKSLPLSYQSLSPVVLRNIGRKNMDLGHFKSLMAFYNQIGVSTSSELIIGLPGETYDSFCEGICTLLECGQHKSINVYACELLPNSQMGSNSYKKMHGIQSIKLPFYQIHCKIPNARNEIQEYSEFVVSTNTMAQEDWIQTSVFSFYIQALHNLGLTRVIAIYLRHEKDISYLNFYTDLVDYFQKKPGTLLCKVYDNIKALTKGVIDASNAWVVVNKEFGNLTWGFEELAFLELVSNASVFFNEISSFINRYNLDEPLKNSLLQYQKSIVKLPAEIKDAIDLDYDFYNYFNKIYNGEYSPLRKVRNSLSVQGDKVINSWEEYARDVVWLGRRDDAVLYTGSRYSISVNFLEWPLDNG